jgi:hypothetical protein
LDSWALNTFRANETLDESSQLHFELQHTPPPTPGLSPPPHNSKPNFINISPYLLNLIRVRQCRTFVIKQLYGKGLTFFYSILCRTSNMDRTLYFSPGLWPFLTASPSSLTILQPWPLALPDCLTLLPYCTSALASGSP